MQVALVLDISMRESDTELTNPIPLKGCFVKYFILLSQEIYFEICILGEGKIFQADFYSRNTAFNNYRCDILKNSQAIQITVAINYVHEFLFEVFESSF